MLLADIRFGPAKEEVAMNFEQLLKFGVDQGASAIHLQAEATPELRIGGLIRNVEGPRLKADELRSFIASIAPKSVAEELDRSLGNGSVFSGSTAAGRFRCSVFSHIGGPGIVMRVVPSTIRGVDELNLPRAVRDLALATRGLILVVGPSGSGKTATLAAMVDLINGAAYQKVVTIESPVEYVFANKKAMVTQMEVGLNAPSFEHGFRLALNQDADVIVIGELREPRVALMALEAAETGRRVLAVMSGLSVIPTIGRLIALIPPEERTVAVSQLANALEGVIAQRLAKTRDGKLRPVVELFRAGGTASKSIAENRLKDLSFFMEGRQGGMQSLDQHLLELHQSGAISGTEAMRLANNPEAVGMGLRTVRQASPAIAPAAASVVDSDPGLVPLDVADEEG
jgi:twitching motility protein PilT